MSHGREGLAAVAWKWRGLLGFAVVLLALAGVFAWKNQQTNTGGTGGGAISYRVTGTAHKADITYVAPSGTTQQNNVSLPLTDGATSRQGISYDFDGGALVYLSAQNTDTGGGDVTCKIVDADGTVIAENTATGFAAVATCQGHAG